MKIVSSSRELFPGQTAIERGENFIRKGGKSHHRHHIPRLGSLTEEKKTNFLSSLFSPSPNPLRTFQGEEREELEKKVEDDEERVNCPVH